MTDRPRIAFIAGEYPQPSEVFLLRELRALRRRGLDFVVVATRLLPDAPEADGIDAEVLLRPSFVSLEAVRDDTSPRRIEPGPSYCSSPLAPMNFPA